MNKSIPAFLILLVYIFCANGSPLWPFPPSNAVAAVEATGREIAASAAAASDQLATKIPKVPSDSNIKTAWFPWFDGTKSKSTESVRLHSQTAGGKPRLSSHDEATGMASTLVERLPERGPTTIDTINSLIETVLNTVKKIIRDIKNKYQDIKDLYRIFYPLPIKGNLPPVQRPNTLVGNLQKLWDNRPTPIKNANIVAQKKIMAGRADLLIKMKLSWLPNSLKPRARQWLIDNAPWLFDALCNGKTHSNPRIQQLAAEIQFKITKVNPSVNNMVIEAICLFKKSPI
jgi:hypothetical protein